MKDAIHWAGSTKNICGYKYNLLSLNYFSISTVFLISSFSLTSVLCFFLLQCQSSFEEVVLYFLWFLVISPWQNSWLFQLWSPWPLLPRHRLQRTVSVFTVLHSPLTITFFSDLPVSHTFIILHTPSSFAEVSPSLSLILLLTLKLSFYVCFLHCVCHKDYQCTKSTLILKFSSGVWVSCVCIVVARMPLETSRIKLF